MTLQALILAGRRRTSSATSRLLGLQVAERIVLNLRKQGCERIAVLGSPEVIPKARRQDLCFIDAPSEAEALQQLLADRPEALLVVPADVLYHPGIVGVLQRAASSSPAVICGEQDDHAAVWIGSVLEAPQLEGRELRDLVAALAGRPDTVRLESAPESFVVPVTDAAGRKRATKLLMKTNWRPHDGIVARLLNKHISVPISRALADVPVTPNQITIFAALFALAGVGLAAWGSYWSFLLGASLLQVQSILDGCDGELARMRYQSSRIGAWLDTIVDDVIGVLWVLALGIGSARAAGSWVYGLVGGIGALLYFVSTGYVFLALFRAGAASHSEFVWFFEEGSDPAGEYPDLRKISTWLKYSVRRDFTVLLFFVLSIFGLIRVSLLLATIGAVGWFITAMIQIGKRGMRIAP